eukprot:scaffold17668_cov60-Cyclotella_meneghiniana.AAC.1
MDTFTTHGELNMSLYSIPIEQCHQISLESENFLVEGQVDVKEIDIEMARIERLTSVGRSDDDTSNSFYREFSRDELNKIMRNERTNGSDGTTIFSFGNGNVLTLGSLRRLLPTSENKWLNDEVINSYLTCVLAKDSEIENNKCYFASSYFYSKMMEIGTYRHVKWRQLEGMFDDGRMAAIPVNIGNLHWIGVIVDIENTKLISLDSLGGDHFEILENIHEYLVDEWNWNYKDRNGGITFKDKFGEWEKMKLDVPEQYNGYDCGMENGLGVGEDGYKC